MEFRHQKPLSISLEAGLGHLAHELVTPDRTWPEAHPKSADAGVSRRRLGHHAAVESGHLAIGSTTEAISATTDTGSALPSLEL